MYTVTQYTQPNWENTQWNGMKTQNLGYEVKGKCSFLERWAWAYVRPSCKQIFAIWGRVKAHSTATERRAPEFVIHHMSACMCRLTYDWSDISFDVSTRTVISMTRCDWFRQSMGRVFGCRLRYIALTRTFTSSLSCAPQVRCTIRSVHRLPHPRSARTRLYQRVARRKLIRVRSLQRILRIAYSLLSKLVFQWLAPLLDVGFSRPLEKEGKYRSVMPLSYLN